MTPDAFRDALSRLNLTQVKAADLFEVTNRTVNRWATGRLAVPGAVEMALQVLIYAKINPEDYSEWRHQERQAERAKSAP